MARRKEAGMFKATVLGAALIGGMAIPAQAQEYEKDREGLATATGAQGFELSATTAFTTDYVFRGVSQTDNNPAVSGSLDAAYGIFYLGMWGSNLDFGGGPAGQDIANVEIDYYAGIAPEWMGLTFDIGGIYYTYPGAYDAGGEFDYFELKTGASYTFGDAFTVGVTNYWSPEFFAVRGTGNATELAAEYTFDTMMNYFDPSISALVGWQFVDRGTDYTYWNVGLTLGFMENFAADIRYWDTDFSTAGCGGLDICDERLVGTLSASF